MTTNSLRAVFRSTTSRCWQALLLIGLLTSSLLTAAAPQLTPYQASYDAEIKGWSATLQRSLSALPGDANGQPQWQLRNQASIMLAGFEERSRFNFQQGQITPLRYEYDNHLSSKRSKTIQFDWQQQQLNTRKGKKSQQLPLAGKGEVFDQLSYQLQLRLALMANPALQQISYTIADTGKFKQYHVKAIGEEWLQTPLGKIKTLKLEQHRSGKDRRTVIWLAPEWQYLIVRLQRFEGGQSEQLIALKEATMAGKKLAPSQ